ncbi:glycosyltransferase [Croceicoccus naphthovorans]|uniref:Uncharacterized protein n=1 Tax=Croceicoccus naphthovorans TaxID=1348774 RepID=A0A0G3XGB4_9SPHN|nr:glycosyltransferase [Croceicoccus naphthovorans]AKM10535.1 hypothetical protein AB433_12090 [Croceicoccus naphthovorans]MBB3988731.1 hypothetical protein [Croceicoccus naphthovorans]
MAGNTKAKAKKPIRVHRVRKVLHIGIDLDRAPWSGTLVRALPDNVENHGTHADDGTASFLQLHRPQFPPLTPRAGPGPMNRMARVMKGYELVVTHGDHAFPATMGHTLFGQGLKLPPLVHYHDGYGEVPAGWWARFRHKLGMARTPVVVAPTQAAARSIANDWQVKGANLHILPPLFPPAPKSAPKPDAIPRMMKRKGEKWIGMRAADALTLADDLLPAIARLESDWHLVAVGPAEQTDALMKRVEAEGFEDRLHVTARLHGPGVVAGLFDLAVLDARDGRVPPDLPAVMAAGVPLVAVGSAGLAELMPRENADWRIDPDALGTLGPWVDRVTLKPALLEAAGTANAAFAAARSDPGEHLTLLAGAIGRDSLSDR